MPIGVYRMFMSDTWRDAPETERLLAELDARPGFLYRLDRVPPTDAARLAEAEASAAIRVAMTQSHVALMLVEGIGRRQASALAEAMLARTGFRRRIPVLAVVGTSICTGTNIGRDVWDQIGALPIDRIVAWDADAIACAVQELAEEATRPTRQLAPVGSGALRPGSPFAVQPIEPPLARVLPIAEIASAYVELVRGRQA